jgi:hypothetical protein
VSGTEATVNGPRASSEKTMTLLVITKRTPN